MNQSLLAFLYLVSAVLFFFGFRGLAAPHTARRGNFLSMAGMVLAIIGVLLSPAVQDYRFIVPGIFIGAFIGIALARKVAMTAMPQLVAALHSFVGLAAVLVALGTFFTHQSAGELNFVLLLELTIGSFIGAITFTGSLIAFGKLQGIIAGAPLRFLGQHWFNLALAVLMLAFAVHFIVSEALFSFALMTIIALALGILLIVPIGGADMPVVVSMLNSYSGWAAAATGFTLGNPLLIITGAFVGSSGAILSYIMCRAMNRSLWNVIFGGFGTTSAKTEAGPQKQIRTAAPEDVAFFMSNASKVIIVPGYGMAVAQAQHAVAELVNALEEKGCHLVTVNDYLSRRDAVWMGQIYYALGLSVGCLNHEQSFIYDPEYKKEAESKDKIRDELGGFKVVEDFLRPCSRKEAYAADITYGTNNEFGFDYLRDNMVYASSEIVQEGYNLLLLMRWTLF